MPKSPGKLHTIRRRPARSGRVSYSDPVILHETNKRRIVFVPFFIKHDSGLTELAAKVVTYLKSSLGLTASQEKSVTLQEPAARLLLKHLNDHLAVAGESEDGNYILLRIAEGTAHFGGHDPAVIAATLTKALGQREIVRHLRQTELSSQLVSALKSAIRLNEMRAAAARLRSMLDSGVTDEATYQHWCDAHSWAFGNAYVLKDNVREITPGDHIDLMLSTVIARYRDIVELKRPDMEVLQYDSKHRNYYFSSELSKAIGQCHRYLDVLHEVAAKGLRDHPEIVAYHPRATIVVGRSSDWDESKLRALHGFNQRLFGISVMTYDHLLYQGERLVQLFSDKSLPEEDPLDSFGEIGRFDDEIPF